MSGYLCVGLDRIFHVAAAASPRLVSTDYPRRSRGATATRRRGIDTSQPRRRRDLSPTEYIHVAAAAPPRLVGETSARAKGPLPQVPLQKIRELCRELARRRAAADDDEAHERRALLLVRDQRRRRALEALEDPRSNPPRVVEVLQEMDRIRLDDARRAERVGLAPRRDDQEVVPARARALGEAMACSGGLAATLPRRRHRDAAAASTPPQRAANATPPRRRRRDAAAATPPRRRRGESESIAEGNFRSGDARHVEKTLPPEHALAAHGALLDVDLPRFGLVVPAARRSSPRTIRVAAAAAPRLRLHEISTPQPRRRRSPLDLRPGRQYWPRPGIVRIGSCTARNSSVPTAVDGSSGVKRK